MFILRTAFWLSLVILLLPAEDPPAGAQDAAYSGEGLTASNVISAAQTTINDISGICTRSPDVCEVGGAALDVFVRKAKYGANRVMEMLSDEPAAGEMKAIPAAPVERQATADDPEMLKTPASQNTLKPEDMEPAWKAPASDRNA